MRTCGHRLSRKFQLKQASMAAILQADGWKIVRKRQRHWMLVKPGHENINLNPEMPLKLERVESICIYAGLSAETFHKLLCEASGVADEDIPVVN